MQYTIFWGHSAPAPCAANLPPRRPRRAAAAADSGTSESKQKYFFNWNWDITLLKIFRLNKNILNSPFAARGPVCTAGGPAHLQERLREGAVHDAELWGHGPEMWAECRNPTDIFSIKWSLNKNLHFQFPTTVSGWVTSSATMTSVEADLATGGGDPSGLAPSSPRPSAGSSRPRSRLVQSLVERWERISKVTFRKL